MAVLASIITSMVVEKRDPSSFRDVEIAAEPQVYRACMEGGGWKTRDKQHNVGTGVTLSCLARFLRWAWMGDVGVRFQVGLQPKNEKKRKSAYFPDFTRFTMEIKKGLFY